MTREEFTQRATTVHGDEYSYEHVAEKVLYDGKVCITCKKHGDFIQLTSNHLAGSGCPQCYGTLKKTTEQFIEEAKRVHGDKYDYSKTVYTGARGKVTIICPIHGEFQQESSSHLKGLGCSKCRLIAVDTDDFIRQARDMYGDEYSYEKTVYQKGHIKVVVTHKKYGDREVLPRYFLSHKMKELIPSIKKEEGRRRNCEDNKIEGEEWRDVVGFEQYYQVSNKGRVRSKDRISKSNKNSTFLHYGSIIKGIINKAGYNRVIFKIRPFSKQVFVHRLVAEAFIPNPDNLPFVNHKDENPSNNCVENLEWCDRQYNNTYGNALSKAHNTRLSNGYTRVVNKIDKEGHVVATYTSMYKAAKADGVSYDRIRHSVNHGNTVEGHIYKVKEG